jgi:hypothetical protein
MGNARKYVFLRVRGEFQTSVGEKKSLIFAFWQGLRVPMA